MAVAVSNTLENYRPPKQGEPKVEYPVKWTVLGFLIFLDPPRTDTKDTIATANYFGVPVKMITGDNIKVA